MRSACCRSEVNLVAPSVPGFQLSNSDNIDHDKQFSGEIIVNGGRYYLIDDFNSMEFIESRFSLLHLNARSLNKNIDQLALFINALNHKFSIIAISETWVNKDISSKPHLPGYSCVSIPRSGRGGVVALFIKDAIIFKCRHDLSNINDNSFENVFIEILNSRKRKLIIDYIYRPVDMI